MTAREDLAQGQKAAKLAMNLHASTLRMARRRHWHVDVSPAILFDVADRYFRDAERYSADEPDGVRPSKHVGYLAFWIRKLKPVSSAFALADALQDSGFPPEAEIVDVNEQIAILYAFEQLADFARAKKIKVHDDQNNLEYTLVADIRFFESCVRKFCGQRVDVNGSNLFNRLVRELRYNTFGPHHLVHIFDQFIFFAFVEGKKGRWSALPD